MSNNSNGKDHLRKGQKVAWYDSMIAGSVSGVVARVATAPMDTVKIRYQLQPLHETKYQGLISTVRTIVKEEGVRALWKGNVPATAMYVIYGAVQFGSYTGFNNIVSKRWPDTLSQHVQSLVVGALAGVTSSGASYPLDLLRTRLVADRNITGTRLIEVCRETMQTEGLRGFFTGISTAMATVTLSTATMFLTYESVNILCEKHESQPWSQPLRASSGMIAGLVSKTIVFPIDTLRRRMQIMNSKRTSSFTELPQVYENYRYKSSISIVLDILKREGPVALYKGLTVGLLKSVPTTAISLFVYEKCMVLLEEVSTA